MVVYVKVNDGFASMKKEDAISESLTYIEVVDQHEFKIMIPVFFIYAKISVYTRIGNIITVIDHSDVIPFPDISEFLTKHYFIDIDSRNMKFLLVLADTLEATIYNGSTLEEFANSIKLNLIKR